MSHTDLGYDCLTCRDTGMLRSRETLTHSPCHCKEAASKLEYVSDKPLPQPGPVHDDDYIVMPYRVFDGKGDTMPTAKVRHFKTGATRDTDQGKHDYEGYLSPKVIKRFGEYMTKNRVQSDGNVRDSDNWQKGIPRDQYIKSLLRHAVEAWDDHRNNKAGSDLEEALCGIMFNAMGYLHETLKRNPKGD